MSLNISGYNFDGPYSSTSILKNSSGVYVILKPITPNNYDIVDVGESGKVKERLENHDRASCWQHNVNGQMLHYAVYYTSETPRYAIEQQIRRQYDPPCGKR